MKDFRINVLFLLYSNLQLVSNHGSASTFIHITEFSKAELEYTLLEGE